MTDAAITRSSTPSKSALRQPHRAPPAPDDLRAMAEAFDRARGGAGGLLVRGQPHPPGQAQVQRPLADAAADPRADLARVAGWRAADERGTADRREAERTGEQALGLVSPSHAPAAAAAPPPAAPPHLDPSGFAQMLADLWTRENGRGDRQVRVRLGQDAWPATGALMTQSPDGLLDVTVELAAGGPSPRTDALADALAGAGLQVGRVALAEG